jgi:hypothetical protein
MALAQEFQVDAELFNLLLTFRKGFLDGLRLAAPGDSANSFATIFSTRRNT